jgi:hypothetical protein
MINACLYKCMLAIGHANRCRPLRENVKITQHVVSRLMYFTSVDDTVYLRIQFFRKASVCMNV